MKDLTRQMATLAEVAQIPLASTAWSTNTSDKVLTSRHNKTILLTVFITVLIAILSFLFLLYVINLIIQKNGDIPDTHTLIGAIFIGLITGLANFIVRQWDKANIRVGIADTLASDILSIGRVLAAGDIIGAFSRLAQAQESTFGSGREPGGFADEARQEDYFKIFDANLADLRGFAPTVVLEITAFYVMLKGSRDATRSMANWSDARDRASVLKRRQDIANILYLCLLSAEHGRRSLEALLERGPMLDYGSGLFLMLELQAIEALHELKLREDLKILDLRGSLVERRRQDLGPLMSEARNLGLFDQLRPPVLEVDRQEPTAPQHGGAQVAALVFELNDTAPAR